MSRQLAVLFALACAALVAVLVLLPPERREASVAGARLKVGDPAPPFPAVEWLGTDAPPAGFEPGKVTVFDVWATWCGPCIQAMPHLAELSRRHAGEGLVVIPVTSAAHNAMGDVREYVQDNATLGLPFAFCRGSEVARDFMAAAGQGGIPTSFVIDRQGKIAFIGHPMDLDDELPAILARK